MQDCVLPTLEILSKKDILDAVDIFLEEGYFNERDVRLLYSMASSHNIPLKIHADEFIDSNGAALACELGALSADHLLAISEKGVKALSNSSTVASLLPGTGYFLGKNQCNARRLLDSGAKVSIASDYNPGSCHQYNVLKVACLSAPNYKMNSTEFWSSITLNAAASLGKNNQGKLTIGSHSKFSFFKTNSIDEITYDWDSNHAIWPKDYLYYLKTLAN